MRTIWIRIRLSVALLTERRLALYAWIDLLLGFAGLGIALTGARGSSMEFYFPFFLLPILFIGVPMLADSVAIERRSGTLDLALTSPGAAFFFERRTLAICALMVVQGCLGVWLAYLFAENFDLFTPFLQIVIVALFFGAVVLNWSVRLKSAGAVMFATYVTAALFGPWVFSNPIYPPTTFTHERSIGDWIDYGQQNLVLFIAAGVFFLYARQRLARPERLIA